MVIAARCLIRLRCRDNGCRPIAAYRFNMVFQSVPIEFAGYTQNGIVRSIVVRDILLDVAQLG